MKKLFNYALLAAALLVGVNVNAANEVSLSINGGAATEYAKFTDALKAICEAAQSNTEEQKTEATITLLTDVAEFGYQDWITNFVQDGSNTDRIKLNKGEYITIDLAGKTLTTQLRFNIYRAGIILTGAEGSKFNTAKTQVFTIYGACNKTASTGASKFVLDKNVVLTNNATGKINNVYCFGCMGQSGNNYSGIQFDIYGKVFALGDGCTAFATNGSYTYNEDGFSIPQIHFYPGSEVHSSNNIVLTKTLTTEAKIAEAGQDPATHKTSASAIYAPGVANLVVEGLVEGGVGIYAKAGHITLNGAVVRATAAEYSAPIAYGNGFYGCGSAIILDSHEGYGELSGVEISNTTVVSDHGYAIEEVATQGQTKLPDIDVNSGTFVGGQGAITTTTEERDKIKGDGTITGGEWHNSDVTPYLDPSKNTVLEFTDSEGKHYQVVVPISKDDMESTIADAAAKEAGERYAYIQENVNPEVVDVDRTIDFLLVDSAATVIVKSGVVLDAGTLMTEGSQIAGKGTGKVIVEAGGTLIISGEQGAYTYDENSLVIETSEANSGIVLINPAVVLNTTPKATIKFISKAWRTNADEKEYQYFGAPTVGGVIKKIVANPATYKTQLDVWNGTGWSEVGIMDGNDDSQLNYDVFNCAFGFYSILSTNPKGEGNRITYTFSGNLYGNSNPKVAVEKGWAPMSNGFTGIMDGEEMLNALENTGVDEVVYTPTQTISGHLQWTGHTGLRYLEEVKPMDVFMLRNNANKNELTLNYKDLVWSPATEEDEGSKAPKANNFAVATVRVDGCGMNDIVTVAEDNVFSADFDNRYDAEKYNNEDIRFYVNADKAYDIYATDNLNNTFVGLMTTKAGKYTISFENVTGNFDLIDNKTNARIAMAEGTTYEFLAEAGEDAYRFTIVAGAQAPTDMQKTNAAVKTTKALINNQIVISNGERFFNVLGTEVK